MTADHGVVNTPGSSTVISICNPGFVVSESISPLPYVQNGPFTVTQDKPFVQEPLKIEPELLTIKVEQLPVSAISEVGTDAKTATGQVIRREVTVFSNVKHGLGAVVTGWNYQDGSGGAPVKQFCYYTALDVDDSSKRIDIAIDRVRQTNLSTGLVPELEGALAKCQWWNGI
jgi:hypothetical protein